MKLIIHKFKRHVDRTINVPATIEAGNGLGKTTILEAISFVLTGKDQNGKDFPQVYDNRVDLHDAIADVSYFDDYNNEFRRVVEPTFTTSRSGEETLKIMRSTRCTKNGIDTNDFSGEFQDFYNFGTDYFFDQKTDQRAIFIDLMKSLLPNYDVAEAQLKMKSLKKTQRDTQSDITSERKALKLIQDVEVKEMPADIEALENEYQNLIKSSSNNQSLISEINRKNNSLLSDYRKQQSDLEFKLQSLKLDLKNAHNNIQIHTATLNHTIETNFAGYEQTDTSALKELLDGANTNLKLAKSEYYTDLNEFAKVYARINPIVSENMERMKRLRYATPENLPEGEKLTDVCSSCGVASQNVLDNGIKNIIDGLKAENKQILESEMRAVNGAYLTLKDERDRLQSQLNRIEEENKKIADNAEKLKRAFDIKKTNQIDELKKEIAIQEKNIVTFEAEISDLEKQLSELKEPTLEELPTELTISDELQEAHIEYQKLRDDIIGDKAINANNKEKKVLAEFEIKKMQSLLMEVDTEIIKLQSEITDYFSNLTNVVDKEFSGKIKIGVQLQELIISRDEYKDVFKITADGKVFPHECNGALINNTKLQVLATLQRLKGYNGITIMDNAEANTTQAIEPCGLNLVIARATSDKELIIK